MDAPTFDWRVGLPQILAKEIYYTSFLSEANEGADGFAPSRRPQRPIRGATGRQRAVVKWSHPPYGKMTYRLRAIASPNGQSGATLIEEGPPGVEDRMKLLLDQDVPISVLVRGPRARMLYEAIRQKQQEQKGEQRAVAMVEPITIVAGIAIVMVIAAVIMLGFMVLYAVLTDAMSKGYDVKDTKYKAAAGEGESRQEHKLVFNLTQPPA